MAEVLAIDSQLGRLGSREFGRDWEAAWRFYGAIPEGYEVNMLEIDGDWVVNWQWRNEPR